MPTIHVFAETASSRDWTPSSLELLGDASALARRFDARVEAWVPSPFPEQALLAGLGQQGCDCAVLIDHPALETRAPEVIAAALAQAVAPDARAILLPGNAKGEEIAALLAGHLGTEWIADALTLSATRTGALDITAALFGGKLSRTYRGTQSQPVVITIREGVAEARKDVRPFTTRSFVPELGETRTLTRSLERLAADPRTQDITEACRIVAGGKGTNGPAGMALVADLAHALEASVAASRVVVDLGWAPAERQVGQTGKAVRPDLYVACGISGASHHLAGMRESKHIIAVNPDASAPIHEVAHLSLREDMHALVPALVEALTRRKQKAVTV